MYIQLDDQQRHLFEREDNHQAAQLAKRMSVLYGFERGLALCRFFSSRGYWGGRKTWDAAIIQYPQRNFSAVEVLSEITPQNRYVLRQHHGDVTLFFGRLPSGSIALRAMSEADECLYSGTFASMAACRSGINELLDRYPSITKTVSTIPGIASDATKAPCLDCPSYKIKSRGRCMPCYDKVRRAERLSEETQ